MPIGRDTVCSNNGDESSLIMPVFLKTIDGFFSIKASINPPERASTNHFKDSCVLNFLDSKELICAPRVFLHQQIQINNSIIRSMGTLWNNHVTKEGEDFRFIFIHISKTLVFSFKASFSYHYFAIVFKPLRPITSEIRPVLLNEMNFQTIPSFIRPCRYTAKQWSNLVGLSYFPSAEESVFNIVRALCEVF